MGRKQREVAGLIRLLHEHMTGEDARASFVTPEGEFDDYPDALLERLRCMTDPEYRECAYGD